VSVLAPTGRAVHPCRAVLRLLLLLTWLLLPQVDGAWAWAWQVPTGQQSAVQAELAVEPAAPEAVTGPGCESSASTDEPDGARADDWVALLPPALAVPRTWVDTPSGSFARGRGVPALGGWRWRERARGPPAAVRHVA
jgi:hypothetical protein